MTLKSFRPLVLVSLVLLTSAANSIDRLSVEVVCQLAEQRYRLALSGAKVSEIEKNCGQQLAEVLGKKFGFLLFVSGEDRDDQLIIRIGKSAQEADPSEFRAVDAEMWVEGSNVSGRGEVVTWTFQKLEDYLRVPAADSFAAAITERFAAEFENIEAHFVRAQLANLGIANTAHPMPGDGSWLLPFTREELGVGYDSVFKIEAILTVAAGTERFDYEVELFGDFNTAVDVPQVYHHKVKALHLRDDKLSREESLERLANAETVAVRHVSVTHYVPINALGRTSPSGLDQSGDGQ
jgi:hypothetical protein